MKQLEKQVSSCSMVCQKVT